MSDNFLPIEAEVPEAWSSMGAARQLMRMSATPETINSGRLAPQKIEIILVCTNRIPLFQNRLKF